MVTPAARRQAVAHACAAHEVSERRACEALGLIAQRCATAAVAHATPPCGSAFGSSPPSGVASATVACISC